MVRRLKNIKNAKVQEGQWQKLWTEIQEWAFVDKKMTQAVEKVRRSTIFNYSNAPLMASFGGTKEAAVKFIISRYHNGRFYFDELIDITEDVSPNSLAYLTKGTLYQLESRKGWSKIL